MCPYPIYLHKHGIDVPCGKCGYCLRRLIGSWTLRCKWEMKRSPYSYFLTLTFQKVPVGLLNDSKSFKRPLQLFFKRCRKAGFVFRYFALGDYGDTFGRPHYHVLFFSEIPVDTDSLHVLWSSRDHQENGFIVLDRVSVHRIRYVVEYGLLARLDYNEVSGLPKPFFLMSKRPAIGSNFLTRERYNYHRRVTALVRDGGFLYAMPRYWKKKILNYSTKTGLGFRAPDIRSDLVLETQLQVKALAAFHKDPETYLWERRARSASSYLNKLRDRKKQKNKLWKMEKKVL